MAATTRHSPSFLDCTSTAPRPSHTIPSGGTFSVIGHSIINAPPRAVYDAILDTSSYKHWNPFITEIKVSKPAEGQTDMDRMTVGAHLKFNAVMSNNSSTISSEVVTCVEPLKTVVAGSATEETGVESGGDCVTAIRWCLDGSAAYVPGFVMRAEHTNEIRDLGDGRTEYVHWETFSGLAAGLVKMMQGEYMRERFPLWADELKAYVEGKKGKKQDDV